MVMNPNVVQHLPSDLTRDAPSLPTLVKPLCLLAAVAVREAAAKVTSRLDITAPCCGTQFFNLGKHLSKSRLIPLEHDRPPCSPLFCRRSTLPSRNQTQEAL